jgi:hypothetical protein
LLDLRDAPFDGVEVLTAVEPSAEVTDFGGELIDPRGELIDLRGELIDPRGELINLRGELIDSW